MTDISLRRKGDKWIGRYDTNTSVITITWGHRPTDDEWLAFIRTPLTSLTTNVTQSMHARRFVFGPISIFVAKEVGGPAWPWPKLLARIEDGLGFVAGWRMTGFHLHIKYKKGD